MAKGKKPITFTICRILRHAPEELELTMDEHGWVPVSQLIANLARLRGYTLTREELARIVAEDNKGRYRLSADGERIKACQGHTIPWVRPELRYHTPPAILYHGTNEPALPEILRCGYLSKMERHAVHMQPDLEKAWQSARRWRLPAAVIEIDAARMGPDGIPLGESDNGVWCAEQVDAKYFLRIIR